MDSNRLIAENDGDIDKILLQEEGDSCLSCLFSPYRSLCIPSSLELALRAQQQLFKTFVVSPVQHKRFLLATGDCLNYVDIRGSGQEYRSSLWEQEITGRDSASPTKDTSASISGSENEGSNTKPTLLLMHGYGSGKCNKVQF